MTMEGTDPKPRRRTDVICDELVSLHIRLDKIRARLRVEVRHLTGDEHGASDLSEASPAPVGFIAKVRDLVSVCDETVADIEQLVEALEEI